jgi:predicted dehydrogenase
MNNARPLTAGTSRRDFLVHGATLAGALAAGCKSPGGSEPPQDQPVPTAPERQPLTADAPLRIGVVGLGMMGAPHLDTLIDFAKKKRENVQVVAVADVCKTRLDPALARARDQQQIDVAGYRDHRQLLARDDLHGVMLAVPEHWHAHMAVDAIGSGKDVYLEKPMTLRLGEALWLERLMAKNPHMRLQVGTQYVMLGKYAAARKLIAEGAIGHPTFSQTSYCRNSKDGEWLYPIDPKVQPGELLDWTTWCGPLGERPFDTQVFHRWRRYKDWSTGIIGDLLVHMMTPLIWALDAGWPVHVSATGGHYIDKAMENHDQVNLTIRFEREHTMTVCGSTCNEQGVETLIRGHKANLFLGGSHCVMRPERVFAEEGEARTIECPRVDDQDELRLDWLRSIRTRRPNASPVELGTKVMVIVDLATRAMWEGSDLAFNPATRTARAV